MADATQGERATLGLETMSYIKGFEYNIHMWTRIQGTQTQANIICP